MPETKAYSVKVELLRPREHSYDFLNQSMYKRGFRQFFKGTAGKWIQLPKGLFYIRTDRDLETVRKIAVQTAIAIDRTAIIRASSYYAYAKQQ